MRGREKSSIVLSAGNCPQSILLYSLLHDSASSMYCTRNYHNSFFFSYHYDRPWIYCIGS